jgi:omega-6 fatty acid desaturase (delta-12 desaturase)
MVALKPLPPPDHEQRPTGLRAVLAVIPDHCYQRSVARGVGLVLRDAAILALASFGLASTNNPLALIPLWVLAGLAVSGLFVLGHDAAHQALFDQRWANDLVGRLAMLPSLHATEVWIFGHNRVHHGHTLRQGMDFVWHPLTVDQYRSLGPLGKLRHRFEWGPLGSGAYYLREIWFNKMVRFHPPERWRRAMRRDQALVAGYAAATLGAALALAAAGGPGAGAGDGVVSASVVGVGLWAWVKVVVVPFLIFCQVIGWVVHVHHIQPDIRWWGRREWNRFRGQVEGTTVLVGPPGWELFFHWIMVHLPHHVDARIPCYRLPEAADAIAERFPDEVVTRPIGMGDYLRATTRCKLHDFETGRWLNYRGEPTSTAGGLS